MKFTILLQNEDDSSKAHDHQRTPKNFDSAFVIGITLNFGFVVIEAIYRVLANSLSLLADAGHNLSDVLASGAPMFGFAKYPQNVEPAALSKGIQTACCE